MKYIKTYEVMKFIKKFERITPVVDISGSMSSSGNYGQIGYFVEGVDEKGILSGDLIFMDFKEFKYFEDKGLVVYEGDLPYGQPVRPIYDIRNKKEIKEELDLMRTAKKYNL